MKTFNNPEIKTRNDIASWLNNKNLIGEAAEIGVAQGWFAKFNVKEWNGKKYHLIDPWIKYQGYTDIISNDSNDLEVWYNGVVECFKENDKVNIIRKMSLEAVNDFKDKSLDWVYIDAFHKYELVKCDIAAWYPKVKKGGFFSGHDYKNGYGVVPAVNEFADLINIETVNLTDEEWATWWVIKQ